MKLTDHLFQIVVFSCMVFAVAACNKKNKPANQTKADSTQLQPGQQQPGIRKEGNNNPDQNNQSQSVSIKINKKQPYGRYLTDGSGTSLYLFLKDTAGKSTCYGQCANDWRPLLSKTENVKAGKGVESNLIGTVRRKNGSMQVSYNNHPLYYYKDDSQAGDVEGQDKKEYGAEWYLVKPIGKKMGDIKEK